MPEDVEVRKKTGPEIQVFLIGISVLVCSIIAPFQASFAPPLKTFNPLLIIPEGKPTHVEPAISEPMLEILSIPMLDKGNGMFVDFTKKRGWVLVEKKIRVQVGDHGGFGPFSENVQGQGGGASEVVFDPAPAPFHRKELPVKGFKLLQANGYNFRQCQMLETVRGGSIHTENPQLEGRAMLSQGKIEGQSSGQIMGVKIGAEVPDQAPFMSFPHLIAGIRPLGTNARSCGLSAPR